MSRDAIELCDVYLAFRRSLGWLPESMCDITEFADHYQWLTAYSEHQQQGQAFVTEAAALATIRDNSRVMLSPVDFSLQLKVTALLGEHRRVQEGALTITLDEFLQRCQHHDSHTIPQYDVYLKQRATLLDQAKQTIRLSEFNPRPLTSFVRNKLISDSYLPLIGGDNLAKQMGGRWETTSELT